MDPQPLGPLTIRDANAYAFRSAAGPDEYVVSVALPAGHASHPSRRFRVLYMLDAGLMGATAVELARLMAMDDNEPPLEPMIVVGIDYPDHNGREMRPVRRWRDYSPAGERFPPMLVQRLGPLVEAAGVAMPEPGGAPHFLRLLEDQVHPWLQANFRASGTATLAGFSYGGLFALHAMFARTPIFDRYLIGSPGILWPDDVIFEEERRASDGGGPRKVALFLSWTDREEEGPHPAHRLIAAHTKALWEVLESRAYPQLKACATRLAGETHHSAAGQWLSKGLRWMRDASDQPSDRSAGG